MVRLEWHQVPKWGPQSHRSLFSTRLSPVAEFLTTALWVILTAWLCILIHEYGHIVLGRLVGVPRRSMLLNFRGVPHVALWDGHNWKAPDDEGYAKVFTARYNSTSTGAWWFIAGGFLLESVTVVTSCLTITFLISPELGLIILSTSSIIFVAYILLDLFASIFREGTYGDTSGLLSISTPRTLALLIVLIAVRAACIALVYTVMD